jgi:ribosomal protein S27AE
MAKSDYICNICKKIKGSNFFGPTEQYRCPRHKNICYDHVRVSGLIRTKRECKECGNGVLYYKFSGKRWEKA